MPFKSTKALKELFLHILTVISVCTKEADTHVSILYTPIHSLLQAPWISLPVLLLLHGILWVIHNANEKKCVNKLNTYKGLYLKG